MMFNACEAHKQIKNITCISVTWVSKLAILIPNVALRLHYVYSTARHPSRKQQTQNWQGQLSSPEREEAVAQMFAAPAALSFCSHSGFSVGVSCSMAAGTTQRPPTGRGWEAGPGVDLP